MGFEFILDERLGIPLPTLDMPWESFEESERAQILLRWEEIRGRIPDRIFELERTIMDKQNRLNQELYFPTCCTLNTEIAELASIITDLHLWYRIHQDFAGKMHG